jgi:hypothetical protein
MLTLKMPLSFVSLNFDPCLGIVVTDVTFIKSGTMPSSLTLLSIISKDFFKDSPITLFWNSSAKKPSGSLALPLLIRTKFTILIKKKKKINKIKKKHRQEEQTKIIVK